jgi:hypothetical protein
MLNTNMQDFRSGLNTDMRLNNAVDQLQYGNPETIAKANNTGASLGNNSIGQLPYSSINPLGMIQNSKVDNSLFGGGKNPLEDMMPYKKGGYKRKRFTF